MSILDDFPSFADVPKNLANLTSWLYQALARSDKKTNARIDGLEARFAGFSPQGGVPSEGAQLTAVVKTLDLNQYPEMTKGGRLTKLQSHFYTLGGEPSKEACLAKLAFFSKPKANGTLAQNWNCSKEEATAWTYILKKRGWLKYSENPKGYLLTENAPLKGDHC